MPGFKLKRSRLTNFLPSSHPTPLDPPLSLMEIAGLHGKPYGRLQLSWQEGYEPIISRFGGTVSSLVSWSPNLALYAARLLPPRLRHLARPYAVLVEQQAIGEYAEDIAQQIEIFDCEEVGLWVPAAKKFRFPSIVVYLQFFLLASHT
ncbi:hypothetical protein BU15DRAFT_81117 [Melanogaster broomeanus]|nr:hypothetical protein BU15DRAFT_81117 [Melanogaster broomeanus]